MMRKIKKRYYQIIIGSVISALILVIAVFGPIFVKTDPLKMDVMNRLTKPCVIHWFGTDSFGRDLFSRIVFGARISLEIGITTMGVSCILGVALGLLAGYYKRLDSILMRIMDATLAFPSILLAMVLIATLGSGIPNIIAALAITNIPKVARMTRGVTLSVKEMDHVEAAYAIGVGDLRIMVRHILPLCLSSIIVVLTSILASTVLAEASLTFLGVGLQPDIPSWGNIINEGRMFLSQAPWLTIIPGFCIMITVLSFNMVGDALRDLLDPRLREN
ncbi:ABC transporter permease [Sediminispirochaeta smaragdinae]|uniref:Binding-protein-dependent transport systems inner membrane component n=1 Tax=Sediminispirochaeta smaragdinae (strain DSM 11293 / JCM 15392 / SEBR 4228) TaxID=573413 RepID=E1R706_SEDSS|nr:ABC transporter permease [Sediminispirochaeta smaragdinae]ADK81333.1 binding-protein-dependent transport systems inner membrane component [Sediminispirochaeta smaragdinae DSM 11293]